MRLPSVALAVGLLFVLGSAARADDVDLRTGRTISGRILKEDEASITIDWRGGEMRIERSLIKEIRKNDGAAKKPAAVSGPSVTVRADPKRAAESAAEKPSAKPTLRQDKSFAERLAAVEGTTLEPWPEEPAVQCTETEAKPYKVRAADGATRLADERPATAEGIDAVWVRNDAASGQSVSYADGQRVLWWYRLWWHEKDREWRPSHPNLAAFTAESSALNILAGDLCSDQHRMVAAATDGQGIGKALAGDAAYDLASLRGKLAEDCAKAMGSAPGGRALAAFHECVQRIELAKSPAEKIKAALERRAIVRELLAVTLVK
jgi:hypothetical protein